MNEAVGRICHPSKNVDKWADDIFNMARDCGPTFHELKRLMKGHLDTSYHKIRHPFTDVNSGNQLTNPN